MMGPFLVLLAILGYAALHSLLATFAAKRRANELLGRQARAYRLVYNLLAVLTFLPVLGVVAAYPGQVLYHWSWPWLLLSSLGQLAAVLLLALGLFETDVWQFIGLRQLVSGRSEDAGELQVGGLYRFVRHPLYSAGLLFIWLTPVMTTTVLAFNLGISLYLYIGSTFEEQRLLRQFGKAYDTYRRNVPRLIPRIPISR